MSYVPASEARDLWAVLGGAFALVASLQAWSARERARPGTVVSRCGDGSRIGLWGRGVRRRPAGREPWRARLARWRRLRLRAEPREDLEPGDLAWVRVREGRAGEGAWVVEGLDAADPPYRLHWDFDSAADALAAYRPLSERIARPPLDAAGGEAGISDREFEARWHHADPRGQDAGR